MIIFEELIKESGALKPKSRERTFFDIVNRGHKENSISDALAYFLDPRQDHPFGSMFLRTLLRMLEIPDQNGNLTHRPEREVQTLIGNKIDLVLESSDWLIVIENKIHHGVANPFADYESYGSERSRGKQTYFALLSIRSENPPINWKPLLWRDYADELRRTYFLTESTTASQKWETYFLDFIENIYNQCGDNTMDEQRVHFVMQHYPEVRELEVMLKEYRKYMLGAAREAINRVRTNGGQDVRCSDLDWPDGRALRVGLSNWPPKTNIIMLLLDNGTYRLQFYVSNMPDEKLESFKRDINPSKFPRYWIEQGTLKCFGFLDTSHHDSALEEITTIASKIDSIYSAEINLAPK